MFKKLHCLKTVNECTLQKLLQNLSLYEQKLITLQQLRAELADVLDEDVQTDLMAGIADIRNQLYVAQRQCQEYMTADLDKETLMEKDVEQVCACFL